MGTNQKIVGAEEHPRDVLVGKSNSGQLELHSHNGSPIATIGGLRSNSD